MAGAGSRSGDEEVSKEGNVCNYRGPVSEIRQEEIVLYSDLIPHELWERLNHIDVRMGRQQYKCINHNTIPNRSVSVKPVFDSLRLSLYRYNGIPSISRASQTNLRHGIAYSSRMPQNSGCAH
jgi:hypothetical protein